MALTDIQRLRLRVADKARLSLHEDVGVGDGLSLAFRTQFAPIQAGSMAVVVISGSLSTVLLEGSGWTLDYDTGLLRLSDAPDVGSVVRVAYQWTAFSDAELEDFLLQAGASVDRAALLVVESLLADGERFLKYTLGQETVDRGAARAALEKLLDQLYQRVARGQPAVVMAQPDTYAEDVLMSPFVEQLPEEDYITGGF